MRKASRKTGGSGTALLDDLLQTPPDAVAWREAEAGELSLWRPRIRELAARFDPTDSAIACGFHADRLGFAFAGGYQAALRRLVPGLPGDRICSLCVTEAGGGHPSAIETVLTPAKAEGKAAGWKLNGHKKWSTLAAQASILLVACWTGAVVAGRKAIRMVRLDSSAPGVQVHPMPATPFAPEITHCELEFTDVSIGEEQILPGDGYADYIKPFRTIEDVFVNAALLGYLFGVATRYDWPRDVREGLLERLVTIRALAGLDPSSPATHIALGGFLSNQVRVLALCTPLWEKVQSAERTRWERDRPLLSVAGRARAKRLESAWGRASAAWTTQRPGS